MLNFVILVVGVCGLVDIRAWLIWVCVCLYEVLHVCCKLGGEKVKDYKLMFKLIAKYHNLTNLVYLLTTFAPRALQWLVMGVRRSIRRLHYLVNVHRCQFVAVHMCQFPGIA